MEEDIKKSIEKEINLIKNLFLEESYKIVNENFPSNDCNIVLTKDFDKTFIDFIFELKEDLFPNRISFKNLGFKENVKLVSESDVFIIPTKGVTSISSKMFGFSKEIKGKISAIYSEKFPLEGRSIFRLILKIKEGHLTTCFLGSKYWCDGSHYSLGLISLEVNNDCYQVFRRNEDTFNYLVIESKNKMLFNNFQSTCESILKSLGFLKGNWYQEELFFFSYESANFDFPNSFYYEYFRKSVITNREIINPSQFRSYINIDPDNYPKLTPLLFPEKLLSKLVTYINTKPEFERAVELVIEGNEIESALIRCSVFSVALETIVALIQSENSEFFKPIKHSNNIKKIIREFQIILKRDANEFSETEYNFLKNKIAYINTPFNKDKYLLSYQLYNIELPTKLKALLDTRNKFFHGKTPYDEGLLKSNIKDLHRQADRLHMLVSILILKYIGYRGHIKNQAAYNLESKKIYEEEDVEIDESSFYQI